MKNANSTTTAFGSTARPDRLVQLAVAFFFVLKSGWLGAQAVPPGTLFPVRVAVKLTDMATNRPVPFAAVRILGTVKGLMADSNGFFSVVITQKDTLKISSLGYYDVFYTKDPSRQKSYYETIPMRSKIYELGAVSVTGKRRKDRDHPMLRWEYKARFQPAFWLFYTPGSQPPEEISPMSPLSFLYDRYSRRGKAARKLRDMVAERARKKRLSQRYNPERVREWTGLDETEIEAFLKFCPMPEAFLEAASEYDIIDRTFRCLEEFDNREEK